MSRRLWAPEFIQTSGTDCGPACLASFLNGFGLPASYGELRDICYTDVDGTSTDDLEDVAVGFGLDAHQGMVPVEHLLHPDAGALPGIVVLALPGGVTHFVVLWRKLGPWVQVMDPSLGRRWIRREELQRLLHVHRTVVPAAQWRDWAGSEAFVGPLCERMLGVGFTRDVALTLLEEALDDPSWRSLATADAIVRMLESIDSERGPAASREATALMVRTAGELRLAEQAAHIPPRFFGARPAGADEAEGDDPEIVVRGAVVVSASGPAKPPGAEQLRGATPASPSRDAGPQWSGPLRASERAAHGTRTGVLRQLLSYLVSDGLLAPGAMLLGAIFAGVVVAFEALLFKSILDVGRWLHAPVQVAGAVLAVALFVALAMGVDLRLSRGVRMLGRRLEARLRMDFFRKLVTLPDRYFARRLPSDVTMRVHSAVLVRGVPTVGEAIVRSLFSLVFITAGIIWLDPGCAPYALAAGAAALGVPILSQARLSELQVSVATYQGGLSRYFLDALHGVLPLRAHAGQSVFRREHEQMLERWAGARRRLITASVGVETIISAVGMLMSGVILYVHLDRAPDTSSVLLILYWAQQLPLLGRVLAQSMMEYPARRAAAARLFEPINTQDDPHAEPGAPEAERGPGVSIAARGVCLEIGRARLLNRADFVIPSGSLCAVVGRSGAGKSSLLGLLLGWHNPTSGEIDVDGHRLDAERRAALLGSTAWVDPQVQLWDRSLLENLTYGAEDRGFSVAEVVEQAGLASTVERLPLGLRTCVGEGGAMLSAGERQRVRLARALHRRDARLVLLDEPFRDLDRPTRARFFGRLRRWWPRSTVLCATHDVVETLGFDRVLVVHEGRIVEQGCPARLSNTPGSVYRGMLDEQRRVRASFDDPARWRRWTMDDGRLHRRQEGVEGAVR